MAYYPFLHSLFKSACGDDGTVLLQCLGKFCPHNYQPVNVARDAHHDLVHFRKHARGQAPGSQICLRPH